MKLIHLLLAATATVQPGQSWTNLDGATLRLSPMSPANARISPSIGWAGSKTLVEFGANSIGWVRDLDHNDNVTVGAGAQVRITGEPRSVWLEAGCVCWVNNPGQLAGVPGGPPIVVGNPVTVYLPNGGMSNVAAGTSWVFRP